MNREHRKKQKCQSDALGDLRAYYTYLKSDCDGTSMKAATEREDRIRCETEPFDVIFEGEDENASRSGRLVDFDTSRSQDLRQTNQFTFTTHGQQRLGSHHGKGGRETHSSIRDEETLADQTRVVMAHMLVELCGTREDASELLWSLGTNIPKESLEIRFHALCSRKINHYRIDKLPGAGIGVSVNFSSLSGSRSALDTHWNTGQAHAICVWIDDNGGIRCTCLGLSRFNDKGNEFSQTYCSHGSAFWSFLEHVLHATRQEVESNLWKAFATSLLALNLSPVEDSTVTRMHNDRIAIVQQKPDSDASQMIWVPVRVHKKPKHRGGNVITYICCFCDMVTRHNCLHAKFVFQSCNGQFTSQSQSTDIVQVSTYMRFEDAVSQLPLTPASCSRSTKMDFEICEAARRGATMVVSAPKACRFCGTPRTSRQSITESKGVVMCTIGPCKLRVDSFKCRNPTCGRVVSVDGREYCMTFERFTTSMTHTVLRQTCEGVALGNGTLTAKIQELLKKYVTLRNANLRDNSVEPRSVKTLLRICVLGMHLMTKEPPVNFFKCPTCDPPMINGSDEVERMRALCIDGIWIGSQSHLSETFSNVTSSCKPISLGVVRRGKARPRSALIRKQTTISLLVSAIRDFDIQISDNSLQAACAVLRILDPECLPTGFFDKEYICGQHGKDGTHDLGDHSTLHRLRALIQNLFDFESVRDHLLRAVLRYCRHRSTTRATDHYESLLRHIQRIAVNWPLEFEAMTAKGLRNAADTGTTIAESITNLTNLDHLQGNLNRKRDMKSSGQVSWEPNANELSDLRKAEVLHLFLIIVEGPLPNVVRREQLPSMRELISLLRAYRGLHLREKLREHRESKNCVFNVKRHSDLLYDNRIVYDGLSTVAHLDEMRQKSRVGVRNPAGTLFADLLEESLSCINEFHNGYKKFTDFPASNADTTVSSAVSYAFEWGTACFAALRQKFLNTAAHFTTQHPVSKTHTLTGNGIESVFTTGCYFPSLPQIRPLPFGIESDLHPEQFGPCSKHYEQKKGSFTPGALTFCCSCSKPVILGFKVLDKAEGPKAVLDVCVSRFVCMPRFLLYDFGCGLYRSAMHTLWWAMENTTICSDAFHIVNHSCSKSFHPRSYCSLDGTNTVAHEQRNGPISNIKKSLRRTSRQSYIVMLAYHVLIFNMRAHFRSDVEHSEMKGKMHEIDTWYFDTKKLQCYCCSEVEARKEENIMG